MAYVDRTSSRNRPLVFTGVALLHAAAGYALVTGLGVSYIREIMPVFEARNVPIEQPSPPPPLPQPSLKPDPVETRVATPKPQLDVRPGAFPSFDGISLPPVPPAPAEDLIRIDPPSPAPSFTPRQARPRGSPGAWATTNDYPARDLREGNQGLTRFSLVVDAEGRVQSCTIVASSGFPGLDKATCDNVSRRARFEPATDGAGARVGGSYSGSIRWQIPRD